MALGSVSEIERQFDQSQDALVLQASDFSLQGLKEMVDDKIIDLSPKYQRRERWDVDRQSELIESFLLNVPVPPIYLAEEGYGIYSIIDGKQRITAVADYLNNGYALRNLDRFTSINGARFRDLPKPLQSALKIRPYLRVITLLKQTHPELKYEVFIRLNRGGVTLNNQEIRNVAFRGLLNDMIYECAENPFLRKSLKIDGVKSAAFKEMQDAEFVLRFLTLQEKWDSFAGSLSRSMDDFMIHNQHLQSHQIDELRNAFNEATSRVETFWGEFAFQRWDGIRWRQQALAGLFDAQMIAASLFSIEVTAKLSTLSPQIVTETQKLFSDSEFEEAVRLGTNTPSRLRFRVNALFEMLHALI